MVAGRRPDPPFIIMIFCPLMFLSCCAAVAVQNPLASHRKSEWTIRTSQVAPSSLVQFTISIRQRNLEKLFATALAVSTPGNPRYGKYLSRSEIDGLTAPSASDVHAVASWLDKHGVRWQRDRETLSVSTTAAAASELLRTKFGVYERSSDGRSIVRASDYELPASVASAVSAMFGLHGAPLPVRAPLLGRARADARGDSHGGSRSMPSAPANVTPAVLAQTYGVILPYVDRAGKGRQAVAEFQGQLMSKMDLEEFFRHEVPGRKPGDDRVDRFAGAPYREGHGVEALLDVEFMMGVAPGVKTEFWEWPNNDFCADLHNYSRALLKPGGPLVNSISYGWQGDLKQVGCHEEDQKAVDVNWAKLAAAGITVFISSGDSGSACRLNGCDEAHLRRAVEIVGERRGASHNLDLYACCEEAQQEHAPGFSWIPPPPYLPKATAATPSTAAASTAAAAASTTSSAVPSAPPPPVPPYAFRSATYHVGITDDRIDFPSRDVHILDGELPPHAGGQVALHSANHTFDDTLLSFGPPLFPYPQKYHEYLRKFNGNLSWDGEVRVVEGHALFLTQPEHICHEIQWLRRGGGGGEEHQLAIDFQGPNPPPPPPLGNCTLFSRIDSTGPATEPKMVSGGAGLAPPSVELYPSWPASSPWVTAVGATRFVEHTRGRPEMAADQFGSGGGFSSLWNRSRASWQEEAVQAYVDRGRSGGLDKFPPAGSFPTHGRATPDISALGEGYQVYVNGEVTSVGGTSASSPAFAGYVSLLNEARFREGKPPMGFFNPFAYQNPSAFTDVTRGTNAVSRSGAPLDYGFAAAPGWDAATGLGTPIFDRLVAAALAI